MRTLSKQEARVVLTLEEGGVRQVSRPEIIGILAGSKKAADHVIAALRTKGWFERISWGQYRLIPFDKGQDVKSKDKRFCSARVVERQTRQA